MDSNQKQVCLSLFYCGLTFDLEFEMVGALREVSERSEQYAANIEKPCALVIRPPPPTLMLLSPEDQGRWKVVTRWHLDIMLSDALSPSPHPSLPPSLLSCLPRLLPPLCAKYTSDVRVFYFYWMRAVCNAFTSVPASC